MNWKEREKFLLKACWFPCICPNHNKNKMCIVSLRKKNEITVSLSLSFISLMVHLPLFSARYRKRKRKWKRLFCVKTIFTPHFRRTRLKTYHVHPNDRRKYVFSLFKDTSGQWTLIVCCWCVIIIFYLGISMNTTQTLRQ